MTPLVVDHVDDVWDNVENGDSRGIKKRKYLMWTDWVVKGVGKEDTLDRVGHVVPVRLGSWVTSVICGYSTGVGGGGVRVTVGTGDLGTCTCVSWGWGW